MKMYAFQKVTAMVCAAKDTRCYTHLFAFKTSQKAKKMAEKRNSKEKTTKKKGDKKSMESCRESCRERNLLQQETKEHLCCI